MMTRPASLLAALTLLAGAAPAAAGEGPSLQARLDRIVEQLETQRAETHVPGMALAVVKDGRVVLVSGFGLADVEGGVPVTDETLFAAGLTTKAFTGTLVAMLVDEGKMSWDDPVRAHLPQYRLADPAADEQVVIRDLLCHRIGLASMTLLWYGHGDLTRDEVLEASFKAELLYPFREKWNYSNVSFLAAGMAAGRAAGTDWDGLLAERIFEPLGMTSSNTSIEIAAADPFVARGYRWDRADERLVHQPMRQLHAIAPAGAINTTARDMAQWLRLLLGRGAVDGRRLVSEAALQETWTKHAAVSSDVGYGLGWFLRERDGKRVIEHAGGIDGFTAEVAFMPEENVGFVLLMNLFASPLQATSRKIVFEALLEDWSVEAGELAGAPDEDFASYAGTYIGNFAQFSDAEFKVLVRDGVLAIDVPGQMVFELERPDEEGKRHFKLTDAIAVRFNGDGTGPVPSLTIFQAGHEFELLRKGAEQAETGGAKASAGEVDTALPSADEVIEMVRDARNAAAMASVESVRQTGTVRLVHMGLEGPLTSVAAPGFHSKTIDFGRFGVIRSTLDSDRASIEAPFMSESDLPAEFVEQMRLEHPAVCFSEWREHFVRIDVAGRSELDGKPVYELRLKPALGPAQTLLVSAETGLPLARRMTNLGPMGQRIPIEWRLEDYRAVEGLVMPHRVIIENPQSGRMVIEIERIETNVPTPPPPR